MKYLGLFGIAASFVLLAACSNDDDGTGEPELFKSSGYVITVQTPSNSAITKYFETLPIGGTADLSTGGTDYSNFFGRDVFDNALYMADPNDDAAMVKIKVRQDESFEIVGSIAVGTRGVMMHIRDSGLGVFQDESERAITVFDPIEMREIGEIDMSDANLQGGEFPRYMDFYYSGNLVYALTRTASGVTPDSLTVHVADVQTGQFVEEQYIDAVVTTWAGAANSVYDESGNAYFGTIGDLASFAPALMFKIDASTGLDTDYAFNVAQTLNPTNFALQNFYLEIYIGNNKALGTVAVDTPAELFQLIADRGGIENLTQEDFQTALNILFTAKNGAWCLFDLAAQTVEVIPGIPSVSSFAVTGALRDGDVVYLPVASDENNEYYSYNINTGETALAFDVVGGSLLSIHSLTQD
ncbi:MAG: hypothetical protein AAGA85_21595 [Bacteroidota bacterium]